uniref:Uncharacterized protein n=1 Tax=Romanomermis culicivorax TaxID=13658 RepID=A0A915ICQ1_ROMCU
MSLSKQNTNLEIPKGRTQKEFVKTIEKDLDFFVEYVNPGGRHLQKVNIPVYVFAEKEKYRLEI